jgi:putrescine aminotransferase
MTPLNTRQLQEMDAQHHLHPFTDTKILKENGSRIITKAEGVYLWDSDGNKIIDGMAGLWCVNIGYGRKELVDVAQEQMNKLPYYNNFFQTTHPPAIELSKVLADISPPQFNHVFFTNSGSEANDTVVRMARYYWALQGKPDKTVIISRENAYHGSTMAGSSLGGMKFMHEQGGIISDIEHIDQPYWFKNGGVLSPDEFGVKAAQALETKIKALGEDKVAAFIGEPIQGAGGVIVPPDTYWPEIQRICEKYGILLIADEVICGFGRLGKWFGSDYYNINADFMPIAKGLSSGYLPIGGLMVADKVAEVIIEKGGEFAHGFTYSGHPAACAVAKENIRILKDEKIIENVENKAGPYLQKRWKELGDHPLVGETRGVGMVAALELVKNKETREAFKEDLNVGNTCRDFCFNNGLIMRAVGDKMIISPPLVLTHDETDELVDKARLCLDLTAKQLGIS